MVGESRWFKVVPEKGVGRVYYKYSNNVADVSEDYAKLGYPRRAKSKKSVRRNPREPPKTSLPTVVALNPDEAAVLEGKIGSADGSIERSGEWYWEELDVADGCGKGKEVTDLFC